MNLKQTIELNWNDPEAVPDVELGTERMFIISVYSHHTGKNHEFPAYYQNRPFDAEKALSVEPPDWTLYNDDEAVNSVGWVELKEHYEYDGFYEGINFNAQYKLMGWSEFKIPSPFGDAPKAAAL